MLSLIKRDIVVSIETFELTFAFDEEVPCIERMSCHMV